MRKNALKWPVYHPYKLNRFSDDLETYARKLLFFMCIYMSDFVQIGLWESGQKRGTDGRPDGNPHYYICEPVAADKNLESNKEDKQDTFCNHCNENEFLGDPKLQSQQARCIKILH